MKVTLGQHSLAKQGGVNQDFHGAMLPTGHLRAARGIALAVADGIGSSRVSQVASSAAVRGFLEDYYATPDAWPVRRAAQQDRRTDSDDNQCDGRGIPRRLDGKPIKQKTDRD